MAVSTLYQLPVLNAVLRDKKTFDWLSADIRSVKCVDLFALYRNIEVAVTDAYGKAKTLNLYDYENELRNSTLTVAGWFATLGDRSLILAAGYPALNTTIANYLPIGFSNESMRLAKRGYDPSHVVPVEDYADVIVAHPRVSPKDLHEHTLCSVNGYFVPSTYHDYGMRLFEAGNVIRRSGELALGMLNFERIGKVTKVPVTENMVHRVDETLSYQDSVVINVGQSLKNKTVGIVIGGHLHLLDGLVKIIGNQSIMISLRRMRYVERVLASRDYLDVSNMGLDVLDVGALVSNLTSDAGVLKYLTGPHTFVVLIDNPTVYVEEKVPDQTARWGQFGLDGREELAGLFDQFGQLMDYWPTYEMGQWALDTLRDANSTFMMFHNGWQRQSRINSGAIGSNPDVPAVATLRYIKARI